MCAAVFRAAATLMDVTRPRNFNSWQIFLSLGSPSLIGSLHVCWLAPKSIGSIELGLSIWAIVLPQTTNMNPKVAKIYLILLVFYMYAKHVISTISPSSTVTKKQRMSTWSCTWKQHFSTQLWSETTNDDILGSIQVTYLQFKRQFKFSTLLCHISLGTKIQGPKNNNSDCLVGL